MEKLLPQLVNLNLDFVSKTIIPQIGIDYAESAANSFLEKLKETTLVVTDENPDNKEQLKLIWGTFTSDPKMIVAFEASFMAAINQISDKTTREALTLITPEIVSTLVVMTDNVRPNGNQIEAIWKDFGKSPKLIAFLLGNLYLIINKLPVPTWLKNVVKGLKFN